MSFRDPVCGMVLDENTAKFKISYDGETYYFKGLARFYSGDKSGACDDWKESALLGETKAMEQLIKNCQ